MSAKTKFTRNAALLVASVLATGTQAQTVSVTTTSDELVTNGQCSLREAIGVHHGGDYPDCEAVGSTSPPRIMLPPGVYPIELNGPNEDAGLTGDFDIHVPLDIIGSGRDQTFIDGNGRDRIFDLHDGGVLRVLSLTLLNGRAPDGLPRDASGGCVRADDGTSLAFRFVTLAGCRAGDGLDVDSGTAGRGGSGGAIFAGSAFSWNGTLQVSDTLMMDNQAGDGGASADGNGGSGGDGGAVSVLGGTLEMFDQWQMHNNAAGRGGVRLTGGRIDGSGGAIALSGVQAGYFEGGTMSGNSAGPAGDARGSGGALHASGSNIAVVATLFNNNAATFGGAVSITNNPVMVAVVNSTATNNTAANGSAFNVINARMLLASTSVVYNSGNQSALRTGGSFNGPTIFLVNSIIAGNTFVDCQGTFVTHGFNLVGSAGGCPADAIGDLTTSDPGLGALQDNGGPTWTHAPNPDSPVVDAGNASLASSWVADSESLYAEYVATLAALDQRGGSRLFDFSGLPNPPGDASDIGAKELGAPVPLVFRDRFESFFRHSRFFF